jgi:hypothetical protein
MIVDDSLRPTGNHDQALKIMARSTGIKQGGILPEPEPPIICRIAQDHASPRRMALDTLKPGPDQPGTDATTPTVGSHGDGPKAIPVDSLTVDRDRGERDMTDDSGVVLREE